MNKKQAQQALRWAERNGYVAYHSGIVAFEENNKVTGYGINIDGDGHDGRLFGCPKIIWDYERCQEMWGK